MNADERWAALRAEVARDRAYYSRKAAEYAAADTSDGEADIRALGRVAMCDDVLRHMDELGASR